ncbi:MAG: flagellar biosynthesis protein FlhA [Pseudomonadota bacterium]
MSWGVMWDELRRYPSSALGVPILLVMILAMMIVPLPAMALDVFFSFNIALSLVIILAVIYVLRPLDFGVFPTVLLLVTLLRLALNVASTRVVLLNGHTGTDAAGRVIQAFGEFVVGGNYAVGLIVFIILVIINFVVVTKGAGRVSEVSARFTLDAMPGKQMAIDADLNAGVISQEEAKFRRNEVREEADFFGAMDGASKFVRGDAVAGILILFINLIGGLIVGTAQRGMALADAARNYTLLTIGDGLVAQVPSLLLSTAVAIIVTRMSRSQDMGEQVLHQLFAQPRVLTVSALILGGMGLIPGMPNFAFLTLAALVGSAAYLSYQSSKAAADAPPVPVEAEPQAIEDKDITWDDVASVDPLGVEVGYRLIPLVDKNQSGELMAKIRGVRKKLTDQLGFLIPPVHIRDNLDLSPTSYRVSLMGVPVAQAEVVPGRELAINPGHANGKPTGIETKDPAFGLDAVWIEPQAKDHAQTLGYTVVDASTVIATHFSQLVQNHASELLGHDEVQHLLDKLTEKAPKLVEELVPKTLSLAVVARVLQDLLAEKINIKNLRKIAETLAEHAPKSQDPAALLGAVRVALGRSIVQDIGGMGEELPVFTLDPKLEQILQDSVNNAQGEGMGIEPNLAEKVHEALNTQTQRQQMLGEPAVLLVPPVIRPWIARFTRQGIPDLNVLAYNEVPDNRTVRLVGAVGN